MKFAFTIGGAEIAIDLPAITNVELENVIIMPSYRPEWMLADVTICGLVWLEDTKSTWDKLREIVTQPLTLGNPASCSSTFVKLTYTWLTTLFAEEPYKRKVTIPCEIEGAKATTMTTKSTATNSIRLQGGYR